MNETKKSVRVGVLIGEGWVDDGDLHIQVPFASDGEHAEDLLDTVADKGLGVKNIEVWAQLRRLVSTIEEAWADDGIFISIAQPEGEPWLYDEHGNRIESVESFLAPAKDSLGILREEEE